MEYLGWFFIVLAVVFALLLKSRAKKYGYIDQKQDNNEIWNVFVWTMVNCWVVGSLMLNYWYFILINTLVAGTFAIKEFKGKKRG